MKLLSRSKSSPAKRIRHDAESAGGAVRMRVGSLLRAFGETTPSSRAIYGVTTTLDRAGLAVVPPLDGLGWDDEVELRVGEGETEAVGEAQFEPQIEEEIVHGDEELVIAHDATNGNGNGNGNGNSGGGGGGTGGTGTGGTGGTGGLPVDPD
jgi:hypothetical protein